jgi:ATP synthase protein I
VTGNNKGRRPGISGAQGPDATEPSESELAARLRKLDAMLDRKTDERKSAERRRPVNAGFAMALRLSTEFVAAILVGAGLGWGIDQLLGIAPWGMIVLLMLGFCAGVLNVLRSAGKMSDPHANARLKSGEDGKGPKWPGGGDGTDERGHSGGTGK